MDRLEKLLRQNQMAHYMTNIEKWIDAKEYEIDHGDITEKQLDYLRPLAYPGTPIHNAVRQKDDKEEEYSGMANNERRFLVAQMRKGQKFQSTTKLLDVERTNDFDIRTHEEAIEQHQQMEKWVKGMQSIKLSHWQPKQEWVTSS